MLDALKRSAEGQKAIRPVAARGTLQRRAGAPIEEERDRRLSGLWRPVAACGTLKTRVGTPLERIADIDAWRPEASMPGWPGWLAWLAGWLGWLAWLAGLAWLDERNAEILTRSTL